MVNVKKNESGFALVQVLLAISAAIALGYYFMQQNETNNKLRSKRHGEEAMETASYVIKTALADIAICTKNLQNQGIGFYLPVLKDASDAVIATPNQEYPLLGGIKLQSMKIDTYKDPLTSEIHDYLFVVYDLDPNDRKKLFGSSTIGKRFRLKGKKDGSGKYLYCYHEDSNLVEQAAIENCENMNGTWINQKCEIDLQAHVNNQPVSCKPGKLQLVVIDGKIKTACKP